jgi:hypothetical protein
MKLPVDIAILVSGAIIALSILFVGRWEISATAYGYGFSGGESGTDTNETSETVYRLDRWTGTVEQCGTDIEKLKQGTVAMVCPLRVPH